MLVALPVLSIYMPLSPWVVFFAACPLAAVYWLVGGWMLWQLRGVERYIITPQAWTYQRGVRGLPVSESLHFDLTRVGKLQVCRAHNGHVRFGFEGHLKLGLAFADEAEVHLFLHCIAPFVPPHLQYRSEHAPSDRDDGPRREHLSLDVYDITPIIEEDGAGS
ncbi:Aste57867_9444 [Aphanomyces stellatus]|uniref:Aste57867_9444 protein n=1 Tax=Aphanomyces stellatus TaxID=120398 RepID=A0A485KN98_9STRA|nr:hypothetical protein As57867_009408 [Aphanomyces stellatus]VFT86324.1 Aste57867_9444 [Aphanomyces stellatus]